MTWIDSFLWWSGCMSWGVAGVVGFFMATDWIIDLTIKTFWTRKEFLAFVWDRMKARGTK